MRYQNVKEGDLNQPEHENLPVGMRQIWVDYGARFQVVPHDDVSGYPSSDEGARGYYFNLMRLKGLRSI